MYTAIALAIMYIALTVGFIVYISSFYTANIYQADIAAGYLSQLSASNSLTQNIQYMKQADSILQNYHTSHDIWPQPGTNFDIIRTTLESNIAQVSKINTESNPFAVQQAVSNSIGISKHIVDMIGDANSNWMVNPYQDGLLWVLVTIGLIGWIPVWNGVGRVEEKLWLKAHR